MRFVRSFAFSHNHHTNPALPSLDILFVRPIMSDPSLRPSLQPNWRSPLLETKLDGLAHALSKLQLLPGNDEKEGTIEGGVKTRVVLVEFWATWCPPCRAVFPHLTEIRAKYSPEQLTIIGVGNEHIRAYRPPHRDPVIIAAFVADQREQGRIAYQTGIDNDDLFKPIFDAVGREAIPTAYILVDDVLKWVGSPWPGEFDEELEKWVKEGSA